MEIKYDMHPFSLFFFDANSFIPHFFCCWIL